MACEQSGDISAENTIILGTYGDNKYFGDYFSPEDIPENGYVIRVTDNPLSPDVKLALICGYSPREVFYAADDFTDDYLTKAIPILDSLPLVHELFRHKLPDYSIPTALCAQIFWDCHEPYEEILKKVTGRGCVEMV